MSFCFHYQYVYIIYKVILEVFFYYHINKNKIQNTLTLNILFATYQIRFCYSCKTAHPKRVCNVVQKHPTRDLFSCSLNIAELLPCSNSSIPLHGCLGLSRRHTYLVLMVGFILRGNSPRSMSLQSGLNSRAPEM